MDLKTSTKRDLKESLFKINQDIYTWKHVLSLNDLEISEFMFKKRWLWFRSRLCSLYLHLPLSWQGDNSRIYFLDKQRDHCTACAKLNEYIAERKRWGMKYKQNIHHASKRASELQFAIKNI